MSESQTPRTDKVIGIAFGADGHGDDYDAYVTMMAHAKELEQESNMILEKAKIYLAAERKWSEVPYWESSSEQLAAMVGARIDLNIAIAAAEKARKG